MKTQLKPILFLFAFVCNSLLGLSQNLGLSGVISFERKENMHKLFEDNDNSWSEERIKHMPKYKTDQFQLSFNTHQTLYKVVLEDENPMFQWVRVAAANTVKIDLDNKHLSAEKTIYEGNYRIDDSIPTYQWKMMGEFRTIAGYTCRKASTILMDSIYVIAFYTDEIPVSSGPESFTGLPGMILGIVLPRLNMTYFATKVETQTLPETAFEMPKSKSKKTNLSSFNTEIKKALKDWGEYGTRVIWKANF
ncbi:MAG: GLPGLI family protein [Bacteroidetes bacterium B1(2017)]|nr:MAG: GLPGLI family protein [Bacteroidetes bacterium B1(2017)]